MKRRVLLVAIILLAGILLWLGSAGHLAGRREIGVKEKGTAGNDHAGDEAKTAPALSRKASHRKDGGQRATHGPQQLKDFFLQEVDVTGLGLEAALQKLKAAYEKACLKTGETPLHLSFVVPQGKIKPLKLKLGVRTLDGSVRLLAAISGLKVKREGAEYRFEIPPRDGGLVKNTLKVPPDLLSILRSSSGDADAENAGLRDLLESLGMDLSSSTDLEFSAGTGTLTLETSSPSDAAALGTLTELLGDRPLQHKLETQVIEIPAGADWIPPDSAQLNDAQLKRLLAELSGIQGVNLSTEPSVTARGGENARIELIRELISPTDEGYEINVIGKIFDLKAGAIGFGHEIDLKFTDTTGGLNAAGDGAVVEKRTDMNEQGFSGDAATRLLVQTRPDGSRTLVLVTPTLIDATGRPLREAE